MRRAQVHQFGVSQFELGGAYACCRAACYFALYTLGSSELSEETLKRYLAQACSDWIEDRRIQPRGASREVFDSANEIYNSMTQLKSYLAEHADRQGLNLSPELLSSEVLAQLKRDAGDAEGVYCYGIAEALTLMHRELLSMNQSPQRLSAVFSTGSASMCVAMRHCADGTLRIDLIDSHAKNVSSTGTSSKSVEPGSASWVTCWTLKQAEQYMLLYHPPVSDLDELKQFAGLGKSSSTLKTQESKKLRGLMFSLTMFRLKADLHKV